MIKFWQKNRQLKKIKDNIMDMKDLIAKLTALEEDNHEIMDDESLKEYGHDSDYDDASDSMYDTVEQHLNKALKAAANGDFDEAEHHRDQALSTLGRNDPEYSNKIAEIDFDDYIEDYLKDNPDAIEHDQEYDESIMQENPVAECGGEIATIPTNHKQDDSVSMTVNMSGSGKGGMKDLLDILRDIESTSDKPSIDDTTMIIGTSDNDQETDEAFANQPREKYSTIKDIIKSGNDLHKSKDSYSDKPYRGDNPMAIKEHLQSLYNFVKSK
jgi:tetratricopeptide (TPR) repeat protein